LRTGLTVTPIGEFSFIIAYIGVTTAVLPDRFFPLAVGVSLITTLAAPPIIRRSEKIAAAVVARQPAWVSTWLRVYHSWIHRMQVRGSRNLLWQVSRKRIVQVGVGMLFVTGLIVFSGQLFAVVDDWLGRQFSPQSVELGFWIALGLIVLAPSGWWRSCRRTGRRDGCCS
jgi:CPA2 family monovalent cation:H+ antiporter-2